MVRITGIEHVQLALPAGGENEARGFYSGLLGLPERAKPDRLAARGGCGFEDPGVKVHLGLEAEFRAAKKAHPGLMVDELAALVVALTTAGVEMMPHVPADGRARCFVSDPFGNRIEMMQA